ncbi:MULTISPECIES: ACT domain-containing protein [Bacillus]|uniref:ACT domain-containing protein n=1 Tax=Bacillus TaxID=1386 RepID=UPI0006905C1B|nr:ACT domain-containing protein [Bacillus sp. UNC322MFChir4.1]
MNEMFKTNIFCSSPLNQIKVKKKEIDTMFPMPIFDQIVKEKIKVDFVHISVEEVLFSVENEKLAKAITIIEQLDYIPEISPGCIKVTIEGAAEFSGVPGIVSQVSSALWKKGVQILQAADSYKTIWVLIKEEDRKVAVDALWEAFNELNRFCREINKDKLSAVPC